MSSERNRLIHTIRPWLIGLISLFAFTEVAAQGQPTVAEATVVGLTTQVNPISGIPVGHFLTDTIDIGRPFQYSLSFWHRAGEDVFFPDTSRNFAPFQVRAIATFPTRTQNAGTLEAMSLDSAVYTLVSFETSLTQPLQVPIRMTNGPDSVVLLATPDTVFLRSHLAVTATPEARTLIAETAVVPLRQEFNYPYLLIALLTLVVVLGVVYSLFNQSIRRQWRLYQLDQRHIRFLREFNRLARGINATTAADVANQVIVRWKAYLERLERQPYSSLTSREIADRFSDDSVTDALREADQMIYGGAFSEQSQAALRVLREVADQIYQAQRSNLRQKVVPVTVTSTSTDSNV